MNNYLEYAISQFIKSGREHAIENVPVNGHTSEEPAGNIVLNLQGDEKWRIDKTYAELNTMYIRGRLTGLVWHLEDESVIFVPLTSKSVFNEQNAFIFSTIITTESGSSFHSFIVTEDDVLTYITEEVGGGGVDTAFQVVGLTPGGEPDVSEPSTQIIYLTKDAGSTATDPYTEWIYTEDGNWEIIGDTSIDLSDYYTKEEIDSALSGKVDAVEGMGLSTNDYSNEDKDKLDNLPSGSELETELGEKVDKVPGKGLSENDYTTAEKEKLGSVATGAEVNVLESVKVDGTNLSIDAKSVNIPVAGGTTGAWVKGVVSGEDTTRWDNWKHDANITIPLPKDTIEVKGHLFKYVQIGNLLVTTKNLDIPLGTVGTNCFWYDDDEDTNRDLGMLYKWSALGTMEYTSGGFYKYKPSQEIIDCIQSQGWRVWSSRDFSYLESQHSGDSTNARHTNMCSTSGWLDSSQGTNELGLNLIPSGERHWDGQSYRYKGYNCVIRYTPYGEVYGSSIPQPYWIKPGYSGSYSGDLNTGASIRLVKDVTA